MTMKLDPRIIKGKKPLDCFDAEEAEKFVGQKGYASDDISTFTDLDFCESGKLEYVVKENGNGICYPYSVVTDYNRKEYAFFLPKSWTATEAKQSNTKTKQVNPEFMADMCINHIEHLICGEDNLIGGYEFERYANEVIEYMKRKVKEIAE